MVKIFLHIMLLTLTVTVLTGCSSQLPKGQPQLKLFESAKIKFRLDDIRPDGLHGSVDSLQSISYEFCVPSEDKLYQAVRQIDPTVQIHSGSSGRIGCKKNQALGIGSTHQSHWRRVLKALSSLEYITEIRQCFFE